MNVLVISASPRTIGRTGVVGRYLKSAYDVELIDLASNPLPLYTGEPAQAESEQIKTFRKKVLEADGVVLVSPEYHGAMSGAAKNALDFLSADQFRNKATAILVCAGGGKGGINALGNMRTTLRSLYANTIPTQLILDPVDIDRENDTLTEGIVPKVQALMEEFFYYTQAGIEIRKAKAKG